VTRDARFEPARRAPGKRQQLSRETRCGSCRLPQRLPREVGDAGRIRSTDGGPVVARGLTRGDVWLHRFSAPDKRGPVLVLSRSDAREVMQTVLVAGIPNALFSKSKGGARLLADRREPVFVLGPPSLRERSGSGRVDGGFSSTLTGSPRVALVDHRSRQDLRAGLRDQAVTHP